MHNVLIRPLELKDAKISWEWRNDPDVWKFTGSKPDKLITYEIERSWLEEKLLEENSRRFAIIVDGNYIGNIQLTNIEKGNKAEYHIFIGNKFFWGKGIAYLATCQIIRFAKNQLQLQEIYLFVNPENVGAVHIYKKCNFVPSDNDLKMVLILANSFSPKVSIFMLVYNHGKFLESALNGLLCQKCNFDYDIVVGEDCSNDNSRNLLIEFDKKFPGKFKLLLHSQNVGAQKNQHEVFSNCSGKYIAICEGDDYWTDSSKLQKQVEFLDNNSDFSICFTDYVVLNQNSLTYSHPNLINKYKVNNTFSRYDIILKNFIPTVTVVFVNKPEILRYLNDKLFPSDWFIHILNSKYGKIKFLPFESAIYRKHDGGVCSASDPILNNEKYLKSIDLFRKQFKKDYMMNFLFIIVKIKIGFESLKIKIKFILKKNEEKSYS